jgi:hypothetical protein
MTSHQLKVSLAQQVHSRPWHQAWTRLGQLVMRQVCPQVASRVLRKTDPGVWQRVDQQRVQRAIGLHARIQS